jgi:hypothetical protein
VLLAAILALALGASALVVAVLIRDESESGVPLLAYHGVTTDPAIVQGATDPASSTCDSPRSGSR